MRESRPHGSGRGAVSNDRPYRASDRVLRFMTRADIPAAGLLLCNPDDRPHFVVRTSLL